MVNISIKRLDLGEEEHFIKDFELSVGKNECVSIVGESGSGKTTLLRAIAQLISYEGYVHINDKYIEEPSGEIQMVFQNYALIPWMKVKENLLYVYPDRKKDNLDKVIDLLEKFDLLDKLNDWPKILSGGEKCRVALIRVLLTPPKLLLLDEPLRSLDVETSLIVEEIIREKILHSNIATIMVTHNVDKAIEFGNRVIIVKKGGLPISEVIEIGENISPVQHDKYRKMIINAFK